MLFMLMSLSNARNGENPCHILPTLMARRNACPTNHSMQHSAGADLEGELGRCWEGLLDAICAQDRPDHSLATALRRKPASLQDLLHSIEIGLQHRFLAVRGACHAFWHAPSVLCTLGRHLQGGSTCVPCVATAASYISKSGCKMACLLAIAALQGKGRFFASLSLLSTRYQAL